MVSIGDVVRAVVSEHQQELSRLNEFIQGGYQSNGSLLFTDDAEKYARSFLSMLAPVCSVYMLRVCLASFAD